MATVIKGTAVAKKLRQGLKADILEIRKEQPEFTPGLTVVQVQPFLKKHLDLGISYLI